MRDVEWITPSRIFLAGWLAFIIGLVIGNFYILPTYIVVWFGIVWLIILWSKQDMPISLLAAVALGLSAGFWLWQQTGGESWFHSQGLTSLAASLVGVRDNIVEHIYISLPEPHGSLMAGIIFGNKLKLDQNMVNDFRAVGLSHVIAVSGYNLTILTTNVNSLFKPLIGRRAIYLGLLIIVLFILITGAPASILRAGVMAGFLLLAELVGRPVRSVNIIILAAGLLALFQPKIIFDVGFQLSVAATYGLLRVTPILEIGLRRLVPYKTLRQILSETLAATIITAPIIITTFSKFSFISPISNILVLPTIPLLMGLGIIGCLGAFIWPLGGHFLLFISYPILAWIIYITHFLATQSFASTVISVPNYFAGLFCTVIIFGFELLHWRYSKQINSLVINE